MSAAELQAAYRRLRDEGAPIIYRQKAYERWFAAAIAEGNDPSRLRRDAPTLSERIEARIIEGLDGCLIWDGGVSSRGQPIVYPPKSKRSVYVRRAVLEQAGREVPRNRRIVATCGNRRCVNIEHLVVEGRHWRANFSDLQMIGLLQVWALRHGHSPTTGEWERSGQRPHSRWYFTRFGSWPKALEHAGLSPVTREPPSHCQRGHPFAGDNLYVSPGGRRTCRTCKRAADRAYWRRKAREREQAD